MPVSIVHNHVSAIPNDPTKDVSSDRWNEAHTVTGLGTAAEADAADFATAAQGALADSALQASAIIDSIADSDTTHAPSRNAVFDALALKLDVTTAASSYQPLDTQLTSLAGLSYGSNALKVVRVNAGETDFELATVSAGITDLTGDVTASGSGSVAATLATTQSAAHTWSAAQTFGSTLVTSAGVAWSSSATAPAQITTAQAGSAYTITASAAVAGSSVAGAAAGGSVTITAGDAARLTSGNADGGDIVLTTGAGIGTGVTGQVKITNAGTVARPSLYLSTDSGTGWYRNAANQWTWAASGTAMLSLTSSPLVRFTSTFVVCWSATAGSTNSADVGQARNAAGVLEVNNGSAGTYRDLKLRNLLAGGGNGSYIQTPSMTVANLAAAATAGAGARAFVTDATATTFLSTVAGGGANKVPVVSDGTNWLIG